VAHERVAGVLPVLLVLFVAVAVGVVIAVGVEVEVVAGVGVAVDVAAVFGVEVGMIAACVENTVPGVPAIVDVAAAAVAGVFVAVASAG